MIGFLDESSLRSDPGRRRVINTPVVVYIENGKVYTKRSMTFFGFMSLNGSDVVMASETAKAPDMASFLEVVRGENSSSITDVPILAVLDNAAIHRANLTRGLAEDLGIFPVFLPPYSPDLNPIEFGWKDLKRELAAKLKFDEMINASGPTALKLFKERKNTYTTHWVKSFITVKS